MISSRVQEQTGLTDLADFAGDHIVDRVGRGRWRLYEDASGYSGTSGQTIKKGKVLRDIDGQIRHFRSKAEAEAEGWRLCDERRARIHNFKKERADAEG